MKSTLRASYIPLVILSSMHSGTTIANLKKLVTEEFKRSKLTLTDGTFYTTISRLRGEKLIEKIDIQTEAGFCIEGVQITNGGLKNISSMRAELNAEVSIIKRMEKLLKGRPLPM